MRAPVEKTRLDRGKPTVRELLSSLVFNPIDGTIRLYGERLVMQRASAGTELRRELTGLLGAEEARVFLMRLGFLTGRADARFVRVRWPNLDVADAFTAGTRIHTFSGVVRVETIYNDFDFRKKRFSAEFLWHDSTEAEEHRRVHRHASGPVCWTQIGYASGYASEFFDTLILYKEVECSAEGHPHCRVVGKPADAWGPGDPEVILFRERIATSLEDVQPEQRRAVTVRAAGAALSELDRLLLAPLRSQLDRFAPMALPVLVEGAAGTGRSRAARYLQRASAVTGGALREISGTQVTHDICAEISRSVHAGRRSRNADAFLIGDVHRVPAEMQEPLARAIEEGLLVGGPRVIAIADTGPGASEQGALSPALRYALSALTLRTTPLGERTSADRLAIAQALLALLAARMRTGPPELDESAVAAIGHNDWKGNTQEMQSVLGAVLASPRHERPVTGREIEAQISRLRTTAMPAGRKTGTDAERWIDGLLVAGDFSVAEHELMIYRRALARTEGNLAAAARLLGLTRAQLAYRLKRTPAAGT